MVSDVLFMSYSLPDGRELGIAYSRGGTYLDYTIATLEHELSDRPISTPAD